MSADYLILVPTNPKFVPDEAAQQRAVAALAELLPEGQECKAEDHGRVTFIDQGENIEAIICPACSKRLAFYDNPDSEAVSEWWYDATENLATGDAEGVKVSMPCCSRSVPLTSLEFDWPAAFARFELNILDPQIGENLSKEQLAEFEKILGCELRQVRAHY